MDLLNQKEIDSIIQTGLAEDTPEGDITTLALFAEDEVGSATMIAKQPGVIVGLPIVKQVFERLDPDFQLNARVGDGDRVNAGDVIAEPTGNIRALLTGERLALNLLQRMCGIATAASAFVEKTKGLPVEILDTRKTAPGLRAMDKYAVRNSGARNHRLTLSDLAMIKDNHIKLSGGITKAVQTVREKYPEAKVEVETETLEAVREAIAAGADIIMLDNMSTEVMKEAVALIDGKCKTEASGNVSIENVRAIAETGVDFISIGAITHSVHALDISLKV